jgi:hypothetical protein
MNCCDGWAAPAFSAAGVQYVTDADARQRHEEEAASEAEAMERWLDDGGKLSNASEYELGSFVGDNSIDAFLSRASLRGAELNGAIITSDQLKQARSTKDRL